MGGDEQEDPGALSPVEDQGSVGDWGLPSWMPRVSGLAWLFIVLAILAVIEHVPVVTGYGLAASLDPGALAGAVAISVPILFPAAVLWRADGRRPRLTGRLALGSVAIGVSAFLDSVISSPLSSWDPTFGGSGYAWDVYGGSEELTIWIVAVVLAVAGPVLLGNAIRGLREGPASRRAIRAGVAIDCLAVAYLAFEATFATHFLYRFVAPPYPGGLMLFSIRDAPESLGAISFIGWAYFAWAVISATGAGTRPRTAWHMSVLAVLIQLGLLALPLVAAVVTLVASPSGDPNAISDLGVAIYRAVSVATPLLTIGSWVLLLAAFAAGLGSPAADEPDAERIELDPLPNPG